MREKNVRFFDSAAPYVASSHHLVKLLFITATYSIFPDYVGIRLRSYTRLENTFQLLSESLFILRCLLRYFLVRQMVRCRA